MKEIEYLKKIINRQIFPELYGPKWRKLYKKELEKCVKDIESKMQHDSAQSAVDMNILKSFLEDTKLIIINDPLDTDMRAVIRELLVLLFNWNKAYAQNKEFELDTLLGIRLIDQTLTISEYLSVSRELLRRLKDLVYFEPPIFELSRHYLQVLLEKYSEE